MKDSITDLFDSVDNLRETLLQVAEENISNYTDDKLIDYANDRINALELENTLQSMAISHGIVGKDFERWYDAALDYIQNIDDMSEIEEDKLLGLLKSTAN
jgi:hypothetical protein